MGGFQIALLSSTLLCSLVAGFLFAFACVVMPGLGSLGDREFLRGFQVVDRVIQNNQPVFVLVWIGSVLALVTTVALGFGRLDGVDRTLLVLAVVAYLGGVQVPTAVVNVPLNNELQTLDLESASAETLIAARSRFEPRWNQWNQIRTLVATLTVIVLLLLVWRL